MIQPLLDICTICGGIVDFRLPNRGIKSETCAILYSDGECCGIKWLRVFHDMPLDIYKRIVAQIRAKNILFCEQTVTIEEMRIKRAEVCAFQASGRPS